VIASSSSRAIDPADRLFLSRQAEDARTELPIRLRGRVNAALRSIRDDPDWIAGVRHVAPARSRHAGCIVDLSVRGVVIVYQIHVKRREVEVIDIYRPMVG
jgi:hypothetical protein